MARLLNQVINSSFSLGVFLLTFPKLENTGAVIGSGESPGVLFRGCSFHNGGIKGGMSLRNSMWHGLRNDIIMRNLMYEKWRKEID